jgi:hypothetical protein
MLRRQSFSVIASCVFATTLFATPPELLRLDQWAESIRPKAAEVKWRQIPWQTDLGEAVRTATAEKRPILVWASGDEPLERC